MKVVINRCFGGFGLSPEATLEAWKRGSAIVEARDAKSYFIGEDGPFGIRAALETWRSYLEGKQSPGIFLTVFSPDESLVLYDDRSSRRDCPILVAIVEEMGDAANGRCAELKIVEIPDGTDYEIQEYDGNERIAERHQTWG